MVSDSKKNRLATLVAKPENGATAAPVVTPSLAHDFLTSRLRCGSGAAFPDSPGGGCAVSGAALDAAAPVTSVVVLGKNRASPPSHPKNREFVRVAVASKLMAGHWKKTGENLKGSSVLGCGRWRNYGADPNIAEIEIPADGAPRMLGHFACRASWSCDHCARARVSQTRGWLRGALMPALSAAGLSGALVTFTIAHAYGDDWGEDDDLPDTE